MFSGLAATEADAGEFFCSLSICGVHSASMLVVVDDGLAAAAVANECVLAVAGGVVE